MRPANLERERNAREAVLVRSELCCSARESRTSQYDTVPIRSSSHMTSGVYQLEEYRTQPAATAVLRPRQRSGGSNPGKTLHWTAWRGNP